MSPRFFWLLTLCSPIPLVLLYFIRLWGYEHYQFSPILLVSIALLIRIRWDRSFHAPGPKTSYLLITLGFLLLLSALFVWSPWMGFLAWQLLFTAFCISHDEKLDANSSQISMPSLFYLSLPSWLCLRLPLNLDEQIPIYLQHATARFSSFCLDQLSVAHHLTGVVFDLPHGKLFIEEACSGIQSTFSLACVSLLLMAYYKRSAVLLPVYILAALFSAALMNVVRIVVIAISQEWWQFDLAHGWLHDLLGYTCLAFAILLLFSFDRLFFVFFFPIRSNAMPIRLGTLKNPLQLIWNFLFTTKSARRSGAFANDSKRLPYPIIGYTLFATLFTYQIAFSSVEIVSNVGTILAASKSDETVDEGWRLGGDKRIWNTPRDLFDRIASIKVESYENKLDGLDVSKGQFADIWQVTPVGATIDCRLAISQPYNRFHDLTTCYTGVGWNIVENKIVAPSSSDNAGVWPLKYSSWETPQGLYGYLTYSGITIDAEPIVVEEISFVDMLKRRFGMNSKRNLQDTECLMFQIWVTSTLPLSAEQVNSITKLHFELEKHVLTQMRKDLGK